MKTYYKVSFEYSEGIYCTNMTHAESTADVEKHYSKYTWCSVREAAPYELDEAKTKGMPIIEIEHEEPATEEPAQTQTGSKEEEKKMENTVKCTYEEKTRNGYQVTWETTDAEQVYSDLAHELISKKINACSYIRSIKQTPLYNGTQKITVNYDHGGRRIYVVSDH